MTSPCWQAPSTISDHRTMPRGTFPTMRCVAIALSLIGPMSAAQSHDLADANAQGVLGILNPKTGAFAKITKQPSDFVPEAVTTYTGTLVFNISINVKTGVPSDASIVCSANVGVYGDTASVSISETKSVKATRTGSTATCSVSIPYAWPLGTPDTDYLTRLVSVDTQGTSNSSLVHRSHTRGLPAIDIPANGATTTTSLNVTL
jgi:hypothetical protein